MKRLPLALLALLPILPGFGFSLEQEISMPESLTFSSGEVPLLLYFKSNNCSDCAPFEALFEQHATRIEQQYNAVCLNVDQAEGQFCAQIYEVNSTPALIIADKHGQVLFRSSTILTDQDVLRILEAGLPQMSEVSQVEREVEELETVVPRERTHLERLASMPATAVSSLVHYSNYVPLARMVYLHTPTPDLTAKSITPTEEALPEDSVESTAIVPVKQKRTWHYAIQLGYFSTRPNALKLVHKAESKGLPTPRDEASEKDGQSYYRVLSGTYTTLEEAQAQLHAAITLGFKSAIYRW